MDWIYLARDRDQLKGLVNTENKSSGSINCWEVLEWLHNLRLL
jgi:hypothetical protein